MHLALRGGEGRSIDHWFGVALHRLFREGQGWPVYCDEETDVIRREQCVAASAMVEAIP
jgi:hypothetical protein